MMEFNINNYLSLKLEKGKTNVYVKNKLFKQCKYLLLNLPLIEKEFIEEIESIDDAVNKLDNSLEFQVDNPNGLTPETLFWGHSSNLQTWFENDYNTSLIHSNLAFPLLKELTKAGDKVAKKIFKDEIASRFETGYLHIIQFLLLNNYLDYLNKEEIECLMMQSEFNLTVNIIRKLNELWTEFFKNYWKIINLIEIILIITLKYDNDYFFYFIENLPENMKKKFLKRIIPYLNYKEFKYTIPYGRYFTFFERILDYVYNKYPNIYDFLNLFNGGYMSGGMSMDERYSYGAISFN